MPASTVDLCSPIAGAAGAACDLGGKLGDAVGSAADAAGNVASFATDPLGFMADTLIDAFGDLLGLGYRVVFEMMQPQFGSAGFIKMYGLALALGAVLCVGVMLWTVISAAVGGRAGELVSSVGRMLLLVPVVSLATPTLLWALVKGTHELSKPLLGGTLAEVKKTIAKMVEAMHGMPAESVGTVLVAAIIGVTAAALLFLEMLFRSGALLLAGLVAPLLFAGLINRNLWTWTRKWVGIVAALILIEPITSGALGLGLWMGLDFNSMVGIFQGITLVLLAVLASGALAVFLPMGGDAVVASSQARKQIGNAGPMAYVPNPSQVSQQSINKHLVNRGGSKATAGKAATGGSAAAGAATGGAVVAAQAVNKTGKAAAGRATGANHPIVKGDK